MKPIIPDTIKELMQKINAEGYNIFIVGGFVRDSIIGKDNDDFDLCSDMPLEDIKKIFPAFVIMRENDHRNTGIIRIDDKIIEISSIRGKDIKEDLSNRDFTINALACDKDGNIIDYFNGIDDINNKKISLVKKDGSGIDNDPARILRALRFQGQLDFTIDEATKTIINDKASLLESVAPERVLKELNKLLMTPKASRIIRNNKNIICTLIPELKNTINFDQHNSYHIYDVFEHTLKVLDNVPNIKELKYAALFHDIGKPITYSQGENGVGHFYGHNIVSQNVFNKFANKYKMNKDFSKKISKLILYHDRELPTKSVSIKKFLIEYGIDDLPLLFKIKEADIMAQNPKYLKRLNLLDERKTQYEKIISEQDCLSIKDLKINGRKLMEMGFMNKEIGFILRDLLTKVTEEQLDNKEKELTEYVSHKYR